MSLGFQFSNQYAPILTTPNEDIDHGDWSAIADLLMRVIIYGGMLVVVVMVVALILKFLRSLHGDATTEQVIATETDRLLSKEATSFTYGTSEEDEELGNCSNSSAEDLYDGKICVICYDEPRNCFLIPCGHCATCYVCAQRIVEGESKACPICRKFINKVRKLLIA